MKKKTEIPTNHPEKGHLKNEKAGGQRGSTKTRADIKAQETDYNNPNNGPKQRSDKKKF